MCLAMLAVSIKRWSSGKSDGMKLHDRKMANGICER